MESKQLRMRILPSLPQQLSLAECALLVGIPQAPAYYNPLLATEATRQRQAVVLGLMVGHGAISH
jgi:membrane peptidoglycan carboxypeptidase